MISLGWLAFFPVAAGAAPARPLVVSGFQSAEETQPRDTWMATALEELLCRRLRRVPQLVVVPTYRVHQAGRELQAGSDQPPGPDRVAFALGAYRRIGGRCGGNPDACRVEIELVDVRQGKTLLRTTLPPGRFQAVADAATRWILQEVVKRDPLPPKVAELVFAAPSESLSAVEYHARALQAARRSKVNDAARYAEQALNYDRRFRPALALLTQLAIQYGTDRARAGAYARLWSEQARRAADLADRAAAELALGAWAHAGGEFDSAEPHYENALAMAYERDDPYGQLAALGNLADLYLTRATACRRRPDCPPSLAQEHMRHAAEWQEAGLEMLTQLGDQVGIMAAATKLALTCEQRDQPETALRWHERALQAARLCEASRQQAGSLLYIGQLHQRAGRLDAALEATQRCLELASPSFKPVARVALAGIYQKKQQPEAALQELEQAYAQLRTGEDLENQFRCLRQIAELRYDLGRQAAACEALAEALEIAEALRLEQAGELRDKLKQWRSEP